VVIGLVVAAALVVGVVYALDAPMAGGWGWLAAVLGLIILASLGLGFVIAAAAESDAQAVQYAMLALLFTLFFSGLVVSWDRLANGVRYLAFLVPATTGTSALQDVMFRGRAPAPWLVLTLAGYTLATLLVARWSVGRQAVA
jgi:ABC-2 type transport system permease protein